MVSQNKIFSLKIKRQAEYVFPSGIERIIVQILQITRITQHFDVTVGLGYLIIIFV